jgi:predicted O-methyltransferase YrrM
MYSKPQLTYRWLRYYLGASNSKGHGIHSPFVYEFMREVLNDNRHYYAYDKIESVKKDLLRDERMLKVNDMGAGSSNRITSEKKISDIARSAVSGQKFGRLLFRLADFYMAKHIIEMGSSLGISAAYLASADPSSQVITIEGSSAIAEIAKETFIGLELGNIQQVTGNFDEKLSSLIASNAAAELVFIDGNHRKQHVLDYFEKFMNKISPHALIIIHDIHWDKEMEQAWEIIQNDPRVKMSIDIFSAGLIFFRDEFKVKQSFTIRF